MSGLGQIILVAGPNGAGKTYFYRKFDEKTGKYALDIDDEQNDTSPGQAGDGATPSVEGRHG